MRDLYSLIQMSESKQSTKRARRDCPVDILLNTLEEQKSTMTDQQYKENMDALALLCKEQDQELYIIKICYGCIRIHINDEETIHGSVGLEECEFVVRAKVSNQSDKVHCVDSVLIIPEGKPCPLRTTRCSIEKCSITKPLFNCDHAFYGVTPEGTEMNFMPHDFMILKYEKVAEKAFNRAPSADRRNSEENSDRDSDSDSDSDSDMNSE